MSRLRTNFVALLSHFWLNSKCVNFDRNWSFFDSQTFSSYYHIVSPPNQFWFQKAAWFCIIFEPFSLVRNVFLDNFGLFSLKTTFFSLTRPIFNYFFGLRYYFETRLDGWLKVNVQSCFCIIYISLIIIRVQLEALKKSKTFQNLHFLVVNRPSLDPSLVFLSVLPSWMWQNNPGKSDLDFDILE